MKTNRVALEESAKTKASGIGLSNEDFLKELKGEGRYQYLG